MKLKDTLRKYKLKRSTNTTFKANDYPGFDKLKTIGIVFQAGKQDTVVLEYARLWRSKGKEVRLLGFVPKRRKDMDGIPSYPWICRSNVSWIGAPSGSELREFLQFHHGVFIDLISVKEHPLDFVTVGVTADFKIGDISRKNLNYDMMLQVNEKDNTRNAFKEIDYYLNFINNTREAG